MISRRSFLQSAITGAVTWPFGTRVATQAAPHVLPNGIVLGRPWPPQWRYPSEHPVLPPYLVDPPDVIPIDLGRQLFVDDFLIQETTCTRRWHRPAYHDASPVLRPDRPWELRDESAERTGDPTNPAAMVYSDGVFFDPRDRIFKMWYMGGYGMSTCLAISDDGLRWRKPAFDVIAGTNIVDFRNRDSCTVWIDSFDAAPTRRFKMAVWHDRTLVLLVSPDGIHWTSIGRTGAAGDRSTFFYNPFRHVWVFSVRADQYPGPVSGRYRQYWEARRFDEARAWSERAPVAWVKADSQDFARPDLARRPELYNLDAVAYESVLLGLFSIWRGESSAREKINEVTVGFSRDGFHWHRPERESFLPIAESAGSWNWANVQSAGGCCLIVGDELYFYVSGREGRAGTAAPGVSTTGLATLRRDGFASMEYPGEPTVIAAPPGSANEGMLTTRLVSFTGAHLFVNADIQAEGELRVEVLDRDGRVIPPFTREACQPVRADGTRLAVRWGTLSLRPLSGRAVRFRFWMTRGRLYAFWVSPWPSGESGGYPAAGGPEFSTRIDVPSP